MKQTSKSRLQYPLISESVDGPPIDFSFKNIRTLEQLNQHLNINNRHETLGNNSDILLKESSNIKQLGIQKINIVEDQKQHPEQKILIVRTIQSNGNHFHEQQQKKNMINKQKHQKKQKKIIIPQTTTLFLRYNKITSIQGFCNYIQPLFPNFDKLMWIDLSHNRLTQLTEDLGKFKNIKTLYLHANYIASFKQFDKLKNASMLRTITIHGNPIQQYGQFRIIVHSILPSLKKMDSTLLTKRQTERASVLIKTLKKYPVINKPIKPPEQSDNDDDL